MNRSLQRQYLAHDNPIIVLLTRDYIWCNRAIRMLTLIDNLDPHEFYVEAIAKNKELALSLDSTIVHLTEVKLLVKSFLELSFIFTDDYLWMSLDDRIKRITKYLCYKMYVDRAAINAISSYNQQSFS